MKARMIYYAARAAVLAGTYGVFSFGFHDGVKLS